MTGLAPTSSGRPKHMLWASSRSRRAFSLVEVVIALGITAFCLAVLLGLLATGLKTSHESSEQLQAAHIAQSLIDTRRAAPNGILTNTFPLPLMGANTVSATNTVYVDANGFTTNAAHAQFGLKYILTAPTSTSAVTTSPVQLYLCLFWPPQTVQANASGHYELITQMPY